MGANANVKARGGKQYQVAAKAMLCLPMGFVQKEEVYQVPPSTVEERLPRAKTRMCKAM